MSAKTISLYQNYLKAQGRAPRAPIDITGVKPRVTTVGYDTARAIGEYVARRQYPNAAKEQPEMTTIMTMQTPAIWTLAEESMKSGRWATARAALDELGLRLDSAYERLQHRASGNAYMPTLNELRPSSASLPSCYRPLIEDRILWVNNLVEQSEHDAEVIGL